MESARRAGRVGDEVQWVIELADLLGDNILGAVADVLGSSDGSVETVARQLSARRTLLILDNAEHLLVPVAEFVTEILGAAPVSRSSSPAGRPCICRASGWSPSSRGMSEPWMTRWRSSPTVCATCVPASNPR